jgi:hypothetical protein
VGRESSLKYRFLEVFYALVVFLCTPHALREFSFRECFPFRVYNIPEFLQNSVFVQVSSSKTMEVVVCGYRMEWPEQFFFFFKVGHRAISFDCLYWTSRGFVQVGWEWGLNIFTDLCGRSIFARQLGMGASRVMSSTGSRGKALGAREVY